MLSLSTLEEILEKTTSLTWHYILCNKIPSIMQLLCSLRKQFRA